jgi:radical SAM superfamily enzyme YgiQ (UPF0313 family)
MRILLIGANARKMNDGRRWQETQERAAYAPTTLTTLAALVPPELDAEVAVIDEAVDRVPEDFLGVDLVGISAMTCDAPRAYQLAQMAQARKITVVLGGYHPTFMPEEAARHADSVVRGFAETAWPQLLCDFARGAIKPLYESAWEEAFASGAWLPQRRLLRRKAYSTANTLEASRGCANLCSFCIVPPMHRKRFVLRQMERIRADIDSMPAGPIALLDPNPLENSANAAELLPTLVGREWFAAASMKSAANRSWVRAARASGCRGLMIGFESLDANVLAAAGKSFNDARVYEETCRMLRDEGVAILGSFVFGFDGEDQHVFERTAEFVHRNRLNLVLYSVYTPFPGTNAWTRLNAQGRILTRDWSLYDGRHAVFAPSNMTVDNLEQGLCDAWNKTYSLRSILTRVAGSRTLPLVSLAANLGFRYYQRTFMRAVETGTSRGEPCEFS